MTSSQNIQDRMNLVDELAMLEADYPTQPPAVQREDMRRITEIRGMLGHNVNTELPRLVSVTKRVSPPPKPPRDLTRARELRAQYVTKRDTLKRHQDHAMAVARATAGPSMTPVAPLATMGPNGGPLLCDHCNKPMVLEGGKWNGKHVDYAWERTHPRDPLWKSYIAGGMSIDIVENGTLRVYHGYPGTNMKYCCNARTLQESVALPVPNDVRDELNELLIVEVMPDATTAERANEMRDMINLLYRTDIGFGVNVPPEAK